MFLWDHIKIDYFPLEPSKITYSRNTHLLTNILGAGFPHKIGLSYLNINRYLDPTGLNKYCVSFKLNSSVGRSNMVFWPSVNKEHLIFHEVKTNEILDNSYVHLKIQNKIQEKNSVLFSVFLSIFPVDSRKDSAEIQFHANFLLISCGEKILKKILKKYRFFFPVFLDGRS